MRIILDLQRLQVEFCANPNLLLDLVSALSDTMSGNDLHVVLNGSLETSILPIRKALARQIRPEHIHLWFAPSGTEPASNECSRLIHEAFLANLQPDLLLLTDFSVNASTLGRLANGSRAFKVGLVVDHLSAEDQRAALTLTTQVDLFITTHQQLAHELPSASVVQLLPGQNAQPSLTALTESAPPVIDLAGLDQGKPRLAYVSPLPPERSGIADYSAELLPFLARYYDIDVVVDQAEVVNDWIQTHCRILSMDQFILQAQDFQRILYHFGNNPMHVKMFDLLERFPGIVVLHDFFLSGVQWYREAHGFAKNALWNELYLAHGYKALQERTREHDEPVVFRYPCNFSVMQKALGVIVHSENSVRLAKQWYGIEEGLSVIPLLRHPAERLDRQQARHELGIADDDFLVCSFGFVGKTKQNHRLLDAWEASSLLSGDRRCKLVYVGDTDDSNYARELVARTRKYSRSGAVKISGWTDSRTYRLYLAAADAAVQLRTLSRGETSAAVLDCLNYGVATVINANGSMADIPTDVVRMIPDEFTDEQLIAQLESLIADEGERNALAQRAQQYLHAIHNPEHCAEGYALSIEATYRAKAFGLHKLINPLADILGQEAGVQQLKEISRALALGFPVTRPARTLFIDVSVVAQNDFKTGIQRVVRALTLALIDAPPEGYRIEPVCLVEEQGDWNYRYARDYTLGLLDSPRGWLAAERMEALPGDILLGLDLAGGYVVQADRQGVYRDLQNRGIKVSFVVYDLIPVQFDNIYPPGFKEGHADWLKVVAKADSAICISKAVADDLSAWLTEHAPVHVPALDIRWFHLGADLGTSSPSTGLPENATQVLQQIAQAPSLLMVGTVEPRKGHGQALDALEQLWAEGCEINLVVVGKEGWMVDALASRFRQHPELGKRLIWLEGISDEFLLKVYGKSSCLLAASWGEGFGLPLIEAAQHGLPVIARDIPVFREVAGEGAFYFSGQSPEDLSQSITRWLTLRNTDSHPKPCGIHWLTWQQSAAQIKSVLLQ